MFGDVLMPMDWQVIDEQYLDYLRDNFEKRIPYTEYGSKRYKPFLGPLFEVKDMVYVTQTSHPQQKHHVMQKNVAFLKIYHQSDGRLISVVNLNYMFPIHKTMTHTLEYKDIEKYRAFQDQEQKSKYIDLLEKELLSIDRLPICENALKIYKLKYEHPENTVSLRCFDFKNLEMACSAYMDRR